MANLIIQIFIRHIIVKKKPEGCFEGNQGQ